MLLWVENIMSFVVQTQLWIYWIGKLVIEKEGGKNHSRSHEAVVTSKDYGRVKIQYRYIYLVQDLVCNQVHLTPTKHVNLL